jgi:hypothetical protein
VWQRYLRLGEHEGSLPITGGGASACKSQTTCMTAVVLVAGPSVMNGLVPQPSLARHKASHLFIYLFIADVRDLGY